MALPGGGRARSPQTAGTLTELAGVRKEAPGRLGARWSFASLWLCGFSYFLAALARLPPRSLYRSSACGTAPPQKPICRGPAE